MTVLRTALVSGSPLVRAGLRAGLVDHGGFDVVLGAASLDEARTAGFGAAEVAVLDLAADAEAEPVDAFPTFVVLLPARGGAAAVAWWRAGASVLSNAAPIATIAAAAQAAVAGLVACEPGFARRLGALPDDGATGDHEPLTPREREVLAQMTAGLGNREIAQALRISPHTAKFHVAQIIAKLDASSRAHAVAKGLRAGLVSA